MNSQQILTALTENNTASELGAMANELREELGLPAKSYKGIAKGTIAQEILTLRGDELTDEPEQAQPIVELEQAPIAEPTPEPTEEPVLIVPTSVKKLNSMKALRGKIRSLIDTALDKGEAMSIVNQAVQVKITYRLVDGEAHFTFAGTTFGAEPDTYTITDQRQFYRWLGGYLGLETGKTAEPSDD